MQTLFIVHKKVLKIIKVFSLNFTDDKTDPRVLTYTLTHTHKHSQIYKQTQFIYKTTKLFPLENLWGADKDTDIYLDKQLAVAFMWTWQLLVSPGSDVASVPGTPPR